MCPWPRLSSASSGVPQSYLRMASDDHLAKIWMAGIGMPSRTIQRAPMMHVPRTRTSPRPAPTRSGSAEDPRRRRQTPPEATPGAQLAWGAAARGARASPSPCLSERGTDLVHKRRHAAVRVTRSSSTWLHRARDASTSPFGHNLPTPHGTSARGNGTDCLAGPTPRRVMATACFWARAISSALAAHDVVLLFPGTCT